ncbi:MAG: RNA polymerase sigma factor [Acidimicrobiales bacterium]
MTEQEFAAWFHEVEPRLRRVLGARLGRDLGREATAEALAWAWEHRERLASLQNAPGYLYTLGIRWARRSRVTRVFAPAPVIDPNSFEPRLEDALGQLTLRQRVSVLMVYGFGWSVAETARSLNLSESSVRTHASRGLDKLRVVMKVEVVAHDR